MGLTFLRRSTIPEPVKGKQAATVPMIMIGENGSIAFNSYASDAMKDTAKVCIAVDADKREVTVLPEKHPSVVKAKVADNDLFAVKHATANGSKRKQVIIPQGASVIRGLFGGSVPAYDYKASGNQSFQLTEKSGGAYSFVLPERMTAKPKVARKKKTATNAVPTTPTPITTQTPVQQATAENGGLIELTA